MNRTERTTRPHFRRFTHRVAMVLLGTAATAGCERPVEPDLGSKGVVEPAPGISLAIAPTGATFAYRPPSPPPPPPGDTGHTPPPSSPPSDGSQLVTATLTRLGGFSGSVGLTVGGAPSGVTADVSNVQATGAVTTATITIVVAAGVAPGVYPLVVHGTGSGVSEVTQPFRLAVTAPPFVGYTLTVTPSDHTVAQAQGGGPPYAMVTLVRTNFTGPVRLSVENLPTGVSFFDSGNQAFASSIVLGLVVAPDAPTGTFTNVLVRGVAGGLPDQTARLTLTIAEAPFTLALSPSALTLVQGGAPQATMVSIVRKTFTDFVTLQVDWDDSMPPGVTGTFEHGATGGNTNVLSLRADAAAVPGVYDLYVLGIASTTPPPPWWVGGTATYCCVPLRVTVVSP